MLVPISIREMCSMEEKIYLSSPHMSDEGYEQQYVKEAFDSNWIAPLGENITQFEKEMCEYVGAKASVALSSGTAAIHLALKLAGVSEGDIVFCQDLTFAASCNPIMYEHATPVFIDSDLESWNMSPRALKEAFKKYPEVKAVIVVHLYGFTSQMDEIIDTCKEHNVPLIEDAAESLGAKYNGLYTGTLGDYGIFSFNGNKIITTSGGGMLISEDEKKLEKAKFWSTQARDEARHYQHSELGYNYRMSNVLAGIGRGQLKVLNERIKKKKYIYDFYSQELSNLLGLQMMPKVLNVEPNYWLSTILLRDDVRPIDIIEELEKANIESRPTWKPMHMQPYYQKYDFVGVGISEFIFENGLCLPSDTKMTDKDLIRTTSIIKSLWD